MKHIVIDENMPAITQLLAHHPVKITPLSGRNISADDVKTADALLVRSVTKVNQALLADSSVSFVGSATIGCDHVDQAWLNANNIHFANSPGCNAHSVVDYVLSVFATLYFEQQFNWWQKRIAVVGCGNVGGRLVARLRALGLEVIAYDPPREEREPSFKSADWQQVLSADIICVHTPLNDTSHHILSADELAKLKDGTLVLNAGRGPCVDNQALLTQLKSSRLQAVLDVFEDEPMPSLELLTHCEIATPHVAGYSLDGKITGSRMVYLALCQHFNWTPCEMAISLAPADVTKMQVLSDDPWAQLNKAIISQYNVRADDGRMRRYYQGAATQFDWLRKHYVERREFSTVAVSPSTELTQAAGFAHAN